jgi:hypothetical protein
VVDRSTHPNRQESFQTPRPKSSCMLLISRLHRYCTLYCTQQKEKKDNEQMAWPMHGSNHPWIHHYELRAEASQAKQSKAVGNPTLGPPCTHWTGSEQATPPPTVVDTLYKDVRFPCTVTMSCSLQVFGRAQGRWTTSRVTWLRFAGLPFFSSKLDFATVFGINISYLFIQI